MAPPPPADAQDEAGPSPQAIRAQVERILASEGFEGSPKLQLFLRHVTEESLAGRGDRLKGYAIGLEVFGKDESFDPQSDSLVRVEARRLRARLTDYYDGPGRDDPVEVALPTGSYAPRFSHRRRDAPLDAEAAPIPQESAAAEHRPARRAPAIAAGLVLAAVLVIAAGWYLGRDLAAPPADPAAATEESAAPQRGEAIAVLPFENLSGDPERDYVSDGVTREIIADLTRFEHLFVIAEDTVLAYKGSDLQPAELGERLRARYLLLGSLRQEVDTIRVTARLIDARSGAHLWAETYDRVLTVGSLLSIQSDISGKIVSTVASPFGVIPRERMQRAARSGPADLAAYDCVLRAHAYWKVLSREEFEIVRDCLERTLEADPDYSAARALYALVILEGESLGFNLRSQSQEVIERGLAAARRAVELDPQSALAFRALYSAHFDRAARQLFLEAGERALTLNPNDSTILADFGSKLAFSGEWERGLALLDKAIKRNPVHPGWYHFAYAINHYRRGELEAALARAERIAMPDYFLTHMAFALIYGGLGDDEGARVAVARLQELYPGFADRVVFELESKSLDQDLVQLVIDGLIRAGLPVRTADRTGGMMPQPG